MLRAHIKLGELYFAGTDPDLCEGETKGSLGSGFHNHTGRQLLEKIIWSTEPYPVMGTINLRSAIDKITARIQAGILRAPLTLTIELLDDELTMVINPKGGREG